ncbi:MAG TPA: ComEC/Rec2 family competence protein [Candidatus Saccharimonadales bacterium]|nr:ComEC/Rec2 family competence protein [Candidatus Saccharimonadales bacterium]
MRRISARKFKRTTLLLFACLAFLAGVGLAHSGYLIGAVWWWLALGASLFTFRKRTVWALIWITLFGLSLGWAKGSIYMQKLAEYQPLYGRKVTIVARAAEDAAYGNNKQLTFAAKNITAPNGQKLTGKIQLSGFGLNAIYQGDELVATGKFYPSLGAYQGRMSFAALKLKAHHPSLVADLRRRFTAGMQSALPEPLASFGMGLLIGQRANLPAEVKQDLLMVGLTHIIAVSGYNLTIMLRASKGILGKRSKRISTVLSLMLIGVFLLFAGSSASIIRAAIVSLLSIGAGYYGRHVKPVLLIALAAAITAFANPFYIWSDASWYLSFLAFYGVMVLAPMIAIRLRIKWQNSLVAMVALESLCAELMTLPFVLHTFGQVSLIGLLANVLVVALVPLAMLLSLVAGLAGMLLSPLAGWFAWPARLLLTYMLDTAHLLAQIPHIFIQHLGLPLAEMVCLYMVTIGVTFLLWQKTKKLRNATITDEIE